MILDTAVIIVQLADSLDRSFPAYFEGKWPMELRDQSGNVVSVCWAQKVAVVAEQVERWENLLRGFLR